jgi:site-specific DNA-methyltransferase (adenine-specific)
MILCGDCLERLAEIPDESVHCCVTSPPYYGLRDYGFEGQIGLEKTPEEYVARLVEVFREVWRVLRADGTLWLNLGDSYTANGKQSPHRGLSKTSDRCAPRKNPRNPFCYETGEFEYPERSIPDGLKPKDLIGIPWRVAFALQGDGWYLRSDIIWHKPNPMPESVTDRCTKAHEYVFMLSKSKRYFYDNEAVKEPSVSDHPSGNGFKRDARLSYRDQNGARGNDDQWRNVGGTRNRRDVWTIATKPYKGAHFAVFPEALAEVCIKAGCPEGGTVLDPFAGSGTTGAVAKSLGRDYILIEANPDYHDLINERLASVEAPPITLQEFIEVTT